MFTIMHAPRRERKRLIGEVGSWRKAGNASLRGPLHYRAGIMAISVSLLSLFLIIELNRRRALSFNFATTQNLSFPQELFLYINLRKAWDQAIPALKVYGMRI
jgi:hypothetical protein